jgi:hypothetical protein
MDKPVQTQGSIAPQTVGQLFNWHSIRVAVGGGSRFAVVLALAIKPFRYLGKRPMVFVVPQSGQVLVKPSRPFLLKHFFGRAAVGAALIVSCMHAGAASALSFNFSFTGGGNPASPATVTGVVSGLVDNASTQSTGLTLTIASATNSPAGGWNSFTDADYFAGNGFDVFGGVVTGVDIVYINNSGQVLKLGNQGRFSPDLFDPNTSYENADNNSTSTNSLLFTPLGPPPAAVPGPLPLFGAGAAFGWSRRLRRRIKSPA